MKKFTFDSTEFEEQAELLKVLAHPVRLCIVRGLLGKGSCNVTTIYTNLQMPQSTISQHLGKLRQAGIVKVERNGLEITYSVTHPQVPSLLEILFDEA